MQERIIVRISVINHARVLAHTMTPLRFGRHRFAVVTSLAEGSGNRKPCGVHGPMPMPLDDGEAETIALFDVVVSDPMRLANKERREASDER